MGFLENFHPIYLIFALILIFSLLFKNSQIKAITITALFILFFVFAETGADYNGYKFIYEKSLEFDVHGEFLYVTICKLFSSIGVSYNLFRIFYMSFFTIMFSFSLYKLSNNFSLSFLIAYFIYVIYFVSALRQFATMAILLFTLYLFFHRKKMILSLFLNFLAIFIHKLAIVQFLIFGVFFIYHVCSRKIKPLEKKLIKKHFFTIIFTCLIIRTIVYLILSIDSINGIFSNLVTYSDLSIINEGLLSRLAILLLLTHYYVLSDNKGHIDLIFSFYFICMLLYFALPFELIMGRLLNNIKLLEVILIPSLMFQQYGNFKRVGNQNSQMLKFSQIAIGLIVITIFVNQIIKQVGYDYYDYMLLKLWRLS